MEDDRDVDTAPKVKRKVAESPRNRERDPKGNSGLIRVPDNPVKPKRNLPFLDRGFVIVSKDSTRQIKFGILEKVSDRSYTACKGNPKEDTKPVYYIRLEPTDNEGALRQLKREVFVLHQAQSKNMMTHFYNMVARGRVPDQFNYLITYYAPMNLDFKCGFSPSDTIRLSINSLKAIRELHELGFIHRNIKPSVFVLVTSQNSPNVVLTTLEYSRRFRNDKDVKSPKILYRMKKTRYLPRCYHLGKEFGRRDDLESWFYMVMHLIDPQLPKWDNSMSDSQLINLKDAFMHVESKFGEIREFKAAREAVGVENNEDFQLIPREFTHLRSYINKLETGSRPDYGSMSQMLHEFVQRENLTTVGPLDIDKQKFGKAKYWLKILGNKKRASSGDKMKRGSKRKDKKIDDVFNEEGTPEEPKKKPPKKQKKKATSKPREKDSNSDDIFETPQPNIAQSAQYASLQPSSNNNNKNEKKKKKKNEDDDEVQSTPKVFKKGQEDEQLKSTPKAKKGRGSKEKCDNEGSKYNQLKKINTPAKTPANGYTTVQPTQIQSSQPGDDEDEDDQENRPNNKPKSKQKDPAVALVTACDNSVFHQPPQQLPKKNKDKDKDEDDDGQEKNVSININSKVPPPIVFNANKVPDLKDEDPKEEL